MAAASGRLGSFGTIRSARRLPLAYRIERNLAVVVLFLSAGPFFDLLHTKAYGSVATQICWAGLYLFALTFLTLRFKDFWVVWTVRHLPAVIFVLAVALLSCAWSLDLSLTLRRSLSLVGTSLIGVYLGMRFPPPDLMRILLWTCVIIVALSVFTVFADPSYGTMRFVTFDSLPEAWKGVLHHKQALGGVAAYGALMCLATAVTRGAQWRGRALVGLVLFAFVVVMAKSATALGALVVATILVLLLLLFRRLRFPFPWVFIVVAYGALIMVSLVTLGLPFVAEFLGRDATLTGRIPTWQNALAIIVERPFNGYGYEAVWGEGSSHLPQFLRTSEVSHAHNGFLNLATQVGLPAALAAIGFVAVTVFRAARAFFSERSIFLTFSVGYIAIFAILNIAGSTLFAYQEFDWVLFMAVSVMVTRIALCRAKPAVRAYRGPTSWTGKALRIHAPVVKRNEADMHVS